jgi:beta-galactosidase
VKSPLPFLFGADVYPELQTRAEWRQLLDVLQRAHMNVVRVGEASWGNLETAPGRFNFGWLREFLDEVERRQMKAILGTGTFIPPQWLVAAHPETLVYLLPGLPSHPMSRHAACLNHPLYREACRRFIGALGQEFKDHPAVIAWQLDNETELKLSLICYNPACERAWQAWLEKTYHTPEEFNARLQLVSWGMKINSFAEVPQPRQGVESTTDIHLPGNTAVRQQLPALGLANYHFVRDVMLGFLAEQAQTLRDAGAPQMILTNWNGLWLALADDPQAQACLSLAGFNFYPFADDPAWLWKDSPWHLDMHRSAYGVGRFLVTETRFGVMGLTTMWDPAPTREQFLMWNLQAIAFGAAGVMYWTGNRWRGGHWPHWGGLLDWSGQPEADFEWAVELGEIFRQWGPALLAHPVKASAVVLTDFDQRAALQVYPHVPGSLSVLPDTFHALHRLGLGTDTLNFTQAEDVAQLQKYALVLIPAATAFDHPRTVAALSAYAQAGGIVILTPFTAYQDGEGVFRGDGFAANLSELTGTLVRTVRWLGSPTNGGKKEQQVAWRYAGLNRLTPVGLDGYCEYLEVSAAAQVIATFKSDQKILDGKPAATERKLGSGAVIKLAFWPSDDSFLDLLQQVIPSPVNFLNPPTPEGVLAVPRTDNSLFIMNVTGREQRLELSKRATDRFTGQPVNERTLLRGYEVLWLE